MPKSRPKLEGEVYYPSDEVVAQANVPDWESLADSALKDLEAFWAERAEELEWFRKWDKVLDDSKKPFFKWFVGGKVNIVHNAVDRHLSTWRKNKLALIWVSEDGKEERTFSYYALHREDLSASHPRDRLRHAGLRQDRRHPFRGFRRILCGCA
jgi:acetyl-CoA synthetase